MGAGRGQTPSRPARGYGGALYEPPSRSGAPPQELCKLCIINVQNHKKSQALARTARSASARVKCSKMRTSTHRKKNVTHAYTSRNGSRERFPHVAHIISPVFKGNKFDTFKKLMTITFKSVFEMLHKLLSSSYIRLSK